MKATSGIVFVFLFFACQYRHTTTGAPMLRYGILHNSPDLASSSGVAITVTNLTDDHQQEVVQTDASGRFEIPEQPGRYAFAATTANAFVFAQQKTSSSSSPVITLSSACYHLHGRLIGKLIISTKVVLSRASTDAGDTFTVTTDTNGNFRACLPRGSYSVRAEGALLSLGALLAITSDTTTEITTYPRSEIEQAPRQLRIGVDDLASFARALTTRQVIGLGEANHGTGDFFTYRGKLSLELARIGHLRNILMEADAIRMMAIDDYVIGRDVDIAKSITALKFWITDVHEFLAFLSEVRTYNAALEAADKVHVLGIDAQWIDPPIQFLLTRRSGLTISGYEASLLEQIASSDGMPFLKLPTAARNALLALLDRLSDPPPGQPDDLTSDRVRASIAARSIHYQLEYVLQPEVFDMRDVALAGLATHIIKLSHAQQSVIWAHNGHIARQPDGAERSLGQHLAATFGAAYYPIALLSYVGTARAWDLAGKIGVISHDLAPPPVYNLESVVMRATNFADVAWVHLDDTDEVLRSWLNQPRYVREFGSVYDPSDTQKLRIFPASFAAVIVLRHAIASTPTSTGVRRATP
jgi:erythromycin esterase